MLTENVSKGYAPKEVSFMGYTTQNLHHAPDAAKAFEDTISRANKGQIKDTGAILTALKHTDQYMKINDDHIEQDETPDSTDIEQWKHAHKMARDALNSIGEFSHHFDYWHNHEHELEFRTLEYTPDTAGRDMVDSYNPDGSLVEELTDKTIKPTDKIKVARVIADMLGVEKAESMSPENAINTGLRKMKTARLTPELHSVLKKMLHLAQSVGIKYDQTLVKEAKLPTATVSMVDKDSGAQIASDILSFKDFGALDKVQKQTHTKIGHSLHPEDGTEHTRKMKVKYKIDEDQDSADYKTSPSGKKYRAHKLNFKNSSSSDMMTGRDAKDDKEPAIKIKPMTKSVKEEVEQIAEISKEKTQKYLDKAQGDFTHQDMGSRHAAPEDRPEFARKKALRHKGISRAINRLYPYKEEVEQVEEDQVEEGLVKRVNKTRKRTAMSTLGGPQPGPHKTWQAGVAAAVKAGRAKLKEEADEEYDDISDEELEKMANSVNHEDHVMDAYDDDEFTFVDLDTGEEVEPDEEEEVNEALMMEVLSRVERMRARTRFKMTQSKRERRLQLVLKRRSDTKTINKRARRLAINMMKQRIMKKPASQLTVTEKERVERMLQSRKPSIDRLAMRLAPRVRQIESQRLSHSKVTEGDKK